MTAPNPARPSRGRSLVLVAAVLGSALALLAVLLVWLEQRYGADSSGVLSRKGYQASPAVVPLALVALAGLVASFAGRGLIGRLIGLVLAGAGVALVVVGAAALVHPPANATAGDAGLPAPAELMGPIQVHWLGPILTCIGGVLIGVAGFAVLAGAVGRRLGARYDAPAAVAARPLSADVADADAAAAWWKALDAGSDPTERAAGPQGANEKMTGSESPPEQPATGRPAGPDPEAAHRTGDPDAGGAVRSERSGQLP